MSQRRHLRGLLSVLILAIATSAAMSQEADVRGPPVTSPAEAPAPDGQPLSEDCFDELENGSGPLLACRVPLRLSPTEQAELENGSRGYVKNVSCLLTIRIGRGTLEAPIEIADHVFQSPEQPVACTVTTYKATFDITATFAPRVVFKDHTAVEAAPGLANVKGVSRVISWPVVQFVNRWPSIQTGMLRVVNAYLARERNRGFTRGTP